MLEADYQSLAARPTEPNGSTPAPRKGHSAAVIRNSICMFGSEGVADEKGRVWVFDTVAQAWSHLDSAPGAPYPSHRTLHADASSELPGSKETVFKERAPPESHSCGTVFVWGEGRWRAGRCWRMGWRLMCELGRGRIS